MIGKAERLEIFNVLDAEAMKAAKAYSRAVTAYDNAWPAAAREQAAMLLEVRLGQLKAARETAKFYFENYVRE